MKITAPVLACLMAAAGACGEPLEKQSEVAKLRLLAISADQPVATPGDDVTLGALWFDPFGGLPTFTWTWCPVADDAGDECSEQESPLAEGPGVDEAVLVMPDVEIVLVRLRLCADAGCDPAIDSIKRVEASSSSSPNANPGIAAFEVDGTAAAASPAVAAGEEVTVSVSAEAGAAESHDGTIEELIVSWFATGGDFDEERTQGPEEERFDVAWTAPSDPGAVTMWAVLRDGRGGVSWSEAEVEVEPR
ncbi:MAG: hypothetical protein HYY06_15875 [Deltaproteobacteria bacterium]|nr:hypothetical protein [Deltaproteobacteria bacterium]